MGKASSSKKVARAARAGGNRRAGQRRNLGFPTMIVAVIVLGLGLVVVTRQDRVANASPRVNDDHWHVPYDTYTCVPDPSTPVTPPSTTTTTPTSSSSSAPGDTGSTTTLSPASGQGRGLGTGHLGVAQAPTSTTIAPATTTTAPTAAGSTTVPATSSTTTTSTSTTVVAQPGDVPGQFQAHFRDALKDVNGIHTHGDGVMHIHPFVNSAAGRNAQLKVFMAQVGVTLTDDTLSFTDATSGEVLTYKEGTTKCNGGKDGIVQVGLWDKVEDAANGQPPNQVITTGVADVRLQNGRALTIAFLPKDSRIPIQSDVKKRFENLTDIATTTTAPSGGSGSDSSGAASSGAEPTVVTTAVPASSASASGG
ncbi:MAG: hypothetical protein ACR2LQ_04035 [Acidimicrobiales bacterium]